MAFVILWKEEIIYVDTLLTLLMYTIWREFSGNFDVLSDIGKKADLFEPFLY